MVDQTNERLFVSLMKAEINHLGRMKAIAASGWVLRQAELVGLLGENKELDKALNSLNDCLREQGISSEHYFAGMMLSNIVSEVELYFAEVVRYVLVAYPGKIGATQFKLSEIIDKPIDEVIRVAADKWLNAVVYQKPLDYLADLCKILSISAKEMAPIWPSYVEAKARRDLGVHNNWVVNDTYLRKIKEVGLASQFNREDNAWPSDAYVQATFETCSRVVEKVAGMLECKYAVSQPEEK